MKTKNNSSYMGSILGEYTLTNHWEEAFAAKTQSPIYNTQDQLDSLSIIKREGLSRRFLAFKICGENGLEILRTCGKITNSA